MRAERRRAPGETAFGILLLAFSVFIFHQGYRIAGFSSISSAGVMPMAAASVMVGSAVWILAEGARRKQPREAAEGGARSFFAEILPPQVAVFLAVVAAYMLTLDVAGFVLGSFLFMFVSILFLERRGVIRALLEPVRDCG